MRRHKISLPLHYPGHQIVLFRRESRLTIRHVTRSKLVFAASEPAISRVSAELQLRAKELNGPETVHNPQEANNSESIHTVHDDVVYFSGEFNCVEFEYACEREAEGENRVLAKHWS